MKAVGIRELKNNLSRFLDDVRRGEHIWVTDRHEVIAELHRPTTPLADRVSRWDAFVERESRRGKLSRPSRSTASMSEAAKLPKLPATVDIAKLLEETRSDRV